MRTRSPRRLTGVSVGGLIVASCWACAGGSARPPGAGASVPAGAGGAGAPPSPSAAVSAPAACAASAFQGGWLIEDGKASLTCEDGTNVALAAGGHVRLEPGSDSAQLTFVDGRCRFPVTFSTGCSLVGAAGIVCQDDDTRYTSRDLRVSRDAAGVFTLLYNLEHPDPDNGKRRCVAGTNATLVRAAASADKCLLDGRWESPTTADGKVGRTSLVIAQGRCTLDAAGVRSEGLCARQAGVLTMTEDGGSRKTSCRAGQSATYLITLADDCFALELEAKSDPCSERRSAIEFLYLRRGR